jgi:hypothetical protein
MITTKITGLSAQGSTEFNGLAYSNNDVAITMASDNVAEDGFKYIFEVVDNNTGNTYLFYVSPNSALNGVFNLKTIFNQLTPTPMVYNTTDVLVHISAPLKSELLNVNNFRVRCYEGWNIAGVFTEDTTDLVNYQLMCVYGSGKQNFIVMGTNDTKHLALSQAYDNTLGFNDGLVSQAINLPASLQSEVINWQKISRSNVAGQEDSAYRILSWIADDSAFINENYPLLTINNFLFELYDESGTIISTFSIAFELGSATLYHLPTGLKNLVNGGYIDQTTADDTAYWTLVGVDIDDNEITAKYGYWIESDCKYNPVHLYWLNQMGGWDSYSFIKKNERSIEVEKKRYKQYLGDYNNATTDNPFSTEAFSRSLTEREPIVKTFLNLNSNWLTESEFKYMRDLFRSKSVWMVDDNVDGYSVVPVVVEDNNYLMRRERNSRKYNQTLRLQIANDNETLNIENTPFPIPAPVACEYYNVFSQITSSGGMIALGTNLGNAANIVLTAASRDRYISISVQDALGATPIAGETYYVRIDYNFSCPSTLVRFGSIQLGDQLTGGGSSTSLMGLQNPGTPIIATGVWGTHTTTSNNFFRLTIPGWSGGATVTGNIYVTVGFGNCP